MIILFIAVDCIIGGLPRVNDSFAFTIGCAGFNCGHILLQNKSNFKKRQHIYPFF